MRFLRSGFFAVTMSAALMASPAIAQADTAIQQTASAFEVRSGETVQFTTTVTNTGPESLPEQNAGLLALRLNSERFVPNPYLSAFTAVGACNTDPAAQPYNYNGARCRLPALAPGESTQIVSTVQVNQSMEQMASAQTAFGASFEEVRAIYPPRVEGSRKIKIRGLPSDGCIDRDFTVTIISKNSKSVDAGLEGPWDEWGGKLESWTWRGSDREEGSKLKFEVRLAKAPAGFYELELSRKPENAKGAGGREKKLVTLQRCGVPDD